jgi:hypothetical protein
MTNFIAQTEGSWLDDGLRAAYVNDLLLRRVSPVLSLLS